MNPRIEQGPDPKFVEHLEWQLRASLRRHSRFDASIRTRSRKFVATAALVLASAVMGATGTVATQHFQAAASRDLIAKRTALLVDFAQRKRELLAHAAEQAKRGYAAGELPIDAKALAQRKLKEAETRFSRSQLDLEEVRTTGAPPRDELSSPQVNGRDFVSERLRLERESARFTLETEKELREWALRRFRAGEGMDASVPRLRSAFPPRFRAGEGTDASVAAAELRVHEAESDVQLLSDRLELRRRFLTGEISGTEVERLDLQKRAADRLQRAKLQADAARESLKTLERMFAAGEITQAEVMKARLEVGTTEAETSVSEIDVQLLNSPEKK